MINRPAPGASLLQWVEVGQIFILAPEDRHLPSTPDTSFFSNVGTLQQTLHYTRIWEADTEWLTCQLPLTTPCQVLA